jgi:hypothetical protein
MFTRVRTIGARRAADFGNRSGWLVLTCDKLAWQNYNEPVGSNFLGILPCSFRHSRGSLAYRSSAF